MTATRLDVLVSTETLARIGPDPHPRVRLWTEPGSGCSAVWRRQSDRTAWLLGVVDSLPGVEWVHTDTAGVDRLPLAEWTRRGITLTNARGAYSEAMGEWVLGAVLAVSKGMPALVRQSDAAQWGPTVQSRRVAGSTVAILGLGSIGTQVARLCSALSMRTVGVVRSSSPERSGADLVLGAEDDWRSVLPDADFLVVTLPLTDDTRGLVDGAVLARLQRGAWLVNVGRGRVVDQGALLNALDSGELGGAVLDAVDPEPLPASSDLWCRPNVIVTPHVSAASIDAQQRAFGVFIDEARRRVVGVSPRNAFNIMKGY
ncbi:D-2-hydroxyacid dehydrogenase [Promicromonospora sp. NPDC023805]|uniref:D-2-hydroxyacid dehydrogenase n=1 Tax=Promicromonospora sp. NPDC023805 TaxID=3154696 RepID=UPI0033CCA306